MNQENIQATDELSKHKFLQYEDSSVAIVDARKIAVYLLNRASGRSQSLKQYRGRVLTISTEDNKSIAQVKFDDIVRHILETRSFDHMLFNFAPLSSSLLDSTAVQHSIPAVGVSFQLPTNIPNFPLTPTLESEGALFTSFQSPIQANILRLHKSLVENSEKIINQNVLEWINDLRMLLNECVSLVDITLHQMYFAAEYEWIADWQFNSDALGQRQGIRMTEKFKWIGKITGKPLNDAENEIRSFKILKGIRNHFNHFDPPCVVVSVDDAANWLKKDDPVPVTVTNPAPPITIPPVTFPNPMPVSQGQREWDYTVLEFRTSISEDALKALLKTKGDGKWELVSTSTSEVNGAGGIEKILCFFRKPR